MLNRAAFAHALPPATKGNVKKGSRVIGRALDDINWAQDYGVVAIGVELGKGRRKDAEPDRSNSSAAARASAGSGPGSVLLAANDLVIFSARERGPIGRASGQRGRGPSRCQGNGKGGTTERTASAKRAPDRPTPPKPALVPRTFCPNRQRL